MARKTRGEAEKTRSRILDAAFEVFTRKGFVRTTLNDIAQAAGVTRGAIYWHFRDKVELFNTLSDEMDREAAVGPEDLPVEEVTSLQRIREMSLEYLSHFENNSRYAIFYEMLLYKTEHTHDLEPILNHERQKHRAIRDKLGIVFTRLKEQGKLRSDLDPSQAALSLVAFIVGLIEVWLFDRTSFSLIQSAPPLLSRFLSSMEPED
ncbi:MAG: TetR family transcriptional regulator [Syntrophobacteraceae bacterium]|jgi:TetR/AcrR family acrAB operon transcriptional repressor|nr:TetR family transcriptional regulator [Syntrophobacteraceae bacterium]